MDVAYITALSALGGSVVGGLTTAITTWMAERAQSRAELRARGMLRREDLFRDFVVAASKAYADALVSNEPRIEDLVELYAMVSRMRILCREETVVCAEKIINATVGTYFEPNKSIEELRHIIKEGKRIDPLKAFAAVARAELEMFIST